jgi:hypothetical protein
LIGFERYAPQNYLWYQTYDLKTGTRKVTTGSEQSGYTQETKYADDPTIEFRTYYKTGNIKSFGKRFVQKPSSVFGIDYPVGITEIYDEDGKLIMTIDHNKTFKFTYLDLIVFLKKLDKGIVIGDIKGTEYNDGNAIWEINYYSPKKERSNIRIDAHNGKILREGHHILLIEN